MHVRSVRFAAVAAATIALTLPALGTASADTTAVTAATASSTEVVTEADVVRQPENTPPTNDWVIYTRTPASSAVFQNGPGTPPEGTGSLTLGTPTGADKVTAFNYTHVGTKLAAIDAMGYSTYRSAGTLQQVASINMEVDFNGPATGGFTTLVFEPVYNTAQGAVVSGQWQDWDAYRGGQAIWWSSRAIPGVCAFDCFVTWDTIVAANPDATILGGYGVNQGSGNPALMTSVDALEIGTATEHVVYDFEFDADGDGEGDTAPPTSKDQCKNGGYKNFNNPSFDNQGECVSYVEHTS
jgi:hypothetical protein